MVQKVRCKFSCEKVERYASQENITLNAVTDGNAEDNSYSKYTPSGKLELSVTNEAVFGFFQPGKKYYLDVTPESDEA